VSRFRSSHASSARSHTNFEIKEGVSCPGAIRSSFNTHFRLLVFESADQPNHQPRNDPANAHHVALAVVTFLQLPTGIIDGSGSFTGLTLLDAEWFFSAEEYFVMKKFAVGFAAVLALLSIAGCAQYMGKGKAPPPVVTKG